MGSRHPEITECDFLSTEPLTCPTHFGTTRLQVSTFRKFNSGHIKECGYGQRQWPDRREGFASMSTISQRHRNRSRKRLGV